jgi:hypothetical protein
MRDREGVVHKAGIEVGASARVRVDDGLPLDVFVEERRQVEERMRDARVRPVEDDEWARSRLTFQGSKSPAIVRARELAHQHPAALEVDRSHLRHEARMPRANACVTVGSWANGAKAALK